MQDRTASETVRCAIRDFDSIREAITAQGERVPLKTPTSMYPQFITKISGRPIIGFAGLTLGGVEEENICGSAQNILQGKAEDVLFGYAAEI